MLIMVSSGFFLSLRLKIALILLINARSLGRESAGSGMVLLAIEDVTDNFRKDTDR